MAIINNEVNEFYNNHRISLDLLELRNLINIAEIITHSALQRKESRGLHFNKDYPESNNKFERCTDVVNTKKDYIMKIVSKA